MSRGKRALFVTLLCGSASCAAAEDHLFEEHHAHEHGVATLDVAVEAARLVLQFRSPALNLVGFEHRPRSAQDHAALSRAMEWLRNPAAQFQPSADASCRVAKSEVTPPDWDDPSGHSEFAADYEFNCQRQAALQHLDVRLLQHLDTDTRIQVRIAAPDGQHSTELTRTNTRLGLRKPSK